MTRIRKILPHIGGTTNGVIPSDGLSSVDHAEEIKSVNGIVSGKSPVVHRYYNIRTGDKTLDTAQQLQYIYRHRDFAEYAFPQRTYNDSKFGNDGLTFEEVKEPVKRKLEIGKELQFTDYLNDPSNISNTELLDKGQRYSVRQRKTRKDFVDVLEKIRQIEGYIHLKFSSNLAFSQQGSFIIKAV